MKGFFVLEHWAKSMEHGAKSIEQRLWNKDSAVIPY